MFRKTNKNDAENTSKKIAPSVISSDVNILGNIISEGLIDFNGNIDGNIHCRSLVIRQHARINGEIRADVVQVAGKVFGTIRARMVTLQNTAHVEGVVMHDQITVEDGATVDGKLKKVSKSDIPSMTTGSGASPSLVLDKADNDEDALIMEHIRLIAANS
jgi:cytoskeletal protein CcmA (bactofilin family)